MRELKLPEIELVSGGSGDDTTRRLDTVTVTGTAGGSGGSHMNSGSTGFDNPFASTDLLLAGGGGGGGAAPPPPAPDNDDQEGFTQEDIDNLREIANDPNADPNERQSAQSIIDAYDAVQDFGTNPFCIAMGIVAPLSYFGCSVWAS